MAAAFPVGRFGGRGGSASRSDTAAWREVLMPEL